MCHPSTIDRGMSRRCTATQSPMKDKLWTDPSVTSARDVYQIGLLPPPSPSGRAPFKAIGGPQVVLIF